MHGNPLRRHPFAPRKAREGSRDKDGCHAGRTGRSDLIVTDDSDNVTGDSDGGPNRSRSIGIAGHDLGITGHTLLGMGGHDGSEYPSGSPEPSQADRVLTQRLRRPWRWWTCARWITSSSAAQSPPRSPNVACFDPRGLRPFAAAARRRNPPRGPARAAHLPKAGLRGWGWGGLAVPFIVPRRSRRQGLRRAQGAGVPAVFDPDCLRCAVPRR